MPPTQIASPSDDDQVICTTCQHSNIAGSAFCENCGAQLPVPQAPVETPPPPPVEAPPPPPVQPPSPPPPLEEEWPETPEPEESTAPQTAPQTAPPEPQAPAPVDTVSGHLLIQETNASLSIPQGKQTIVIGREDPVSGIFPDIDLDPMGGHEAGVGRRHAQISVHDGQLYVEDLDSVNGTALNKEKLSPRQPQPLKDGDELRLGKMVLIYQTE
jgi:pSer/pThr/pTyr-binding forkhead associated (FHA) protein